MKTEIIPTESGYGIPVRKLIIIDNGDVRELTIASAVALDKINVHDADKEADEMIYFYVDEEDFNNLSDAELAKKLDEPFDLASAEEIQASDYNTIVAWADEQGLNTDTPENFKDARNAYIEFLKKGVFNALEDEVTTEEIAKAATGNTLHQRVREKMLNGIAHFVFEKKGGAYRHAYGTIKGELLPQHDAKHLEALKETVKEDLKTIQSYLTSNDVSKGKLVMREAYLIGFIETLAPAYQRPQKEDGTNQPYYDLEAQAWRSYRIDSLVDLR